MNILKISRAKVGYNQDGAKLENCRIVLDSRTFQGYKSPKRTEYFVTVYWFKNGEKSVEDCKNLILKNEGNISRNKYFKESMPFSGSLRECEERVELLKASVKAMKKMYIYTK